jgi:hypothetical protein
MLQEGKPLPAHNGFFVVLSTRPSFVPPAHTHAAGIQKNRA